MIQVLCPLTRIALWWTIGRSLAIGVALVMLLSALITPWGLTQSHGTADLAVLDHEYAGESDDGHGHSHDDDSQVPNDSHAHHAGDHTHDLVYVLPLVALGMSKATAIWQELPHNAGPAPSLDGLERPPRT
ncbi:hypothetical protein os4_37550 (plasmid) [Comamonadaceae bacterium OS-4]|nr:hypothetical protein os4_37550 [Comamonadaceae bacterium OS-4]